MRRTYLNTLKVFGVFCVVGPVLEFVYGKFWSIVGVAPWIYPNSPLEYTSLEGMPLWGLAGVIAASIIQAIRINSVRPLIVSVPALVLGVAWILVYSFLISGAL